MGGAGQTSLKVALSLEWNLHLTTFGRGFRRGILWGIGRKCGGEASYQVQRLGKKYYARFSRRLFVTTVTLESAIATEASTGDRCHPVNG